MSDNEKIEGLKWPSCEFCGKELELIRPHVFDECNCEGAVAARQAEPCRCINPQIEGDRCTGCGKALYANDSDGWISLEGKSASEVKELFKGTELQLDSSIDTHIANEKLSPMTEDKKEPSAKTADKCIHCGLEYARHKYQDNNCPDTVTEEIREGYSQGWAPTIFATTTIEKLQQELSDLKLRLSGSKLTDEEIEKAIDKEYQYATTHVGDQLEGSDFITDCERKAARKFAEWARSYGGESPEVTALREQVEKLKQENERLKKDSEMLKKYRDAIENRIHERDMALIDVDNLKEEVVQLKNKVKNLEKDRFFGIL